jgi:hypothetical protein
MKKKILSGVLAVCMMFGSAAYLPQNSFFNSTTITAVAATEGLFEYVKLDTYSAVTKYNGMATNVVIPEKLGGKPVCYILDKAFKDNENIETVKIPSEVITIGFEAFSGCSKLKTLKDFNKTKVTGIGSSAFYNCESLEMNYSDFPSTLLSVNKEAFYNCQRLEGINLTNVTSIEESAFEGCSSLTTLSMPKATKFGASAFRDCINLQSVTLPEDIKELPDRMFQGCSKLVFTIPSYVTSIGDYCFEACDSFTHIVVPPDVTHIGQFALGWKYVKHAHSTAYEKTTDAIYCYPKSRETVEYYLSDDGKIDWYRYTIIVIDCNHTYEDKVTKEATCTEKGVITHFCTQCHDSYTTTIEATGHDWGPWVITKPVTEESDGIETQTCNNCGKKQSRFISHEDAKVIKEVAITLEEPKAGEKVSYSATTDDPDHVYTYTMMNERRRRGRVDSWLEYDALNKKDVPIYEGYIAKSGTSYTANIKIMTTDSNVVLSDDLKVTVNGRNVDYLETGSSYASFSIRFNTKGTVLKGDVNGDGLINVTDITKAAAHVKGKKLLTGDAFDRADVNSDGVVNVTDITKIAAHVKGKKLLK